MPAGGHGALRSPGFLALLAALLLSAGLAGWLLWPPGPAQAQEGEPPPVDNLRCLAETDRIAFLWEAAEWSGGETTSYEYHLTLPDDSQSSGGVGKGPSRTSLVLRPGSYSLGDQTRFRVKANYKTPGGRDVAGPEATLTCYVGGAHSLAITPVNTTRVYGEADGMSYTVSGLVDGDSVSDVVSGNLGRTDGDDAGTYAINLGTLAIAPDYATKYALPSGPATTTYTITPKAAAYTATGANKLYDGTTAAPASLGGSFAAGDILSGDVVTVTGGTYPSADAGTGLAITGSSVSGADASNYNVTFSVSGDITPRPVTAISGVRVSPRLPDGTTTAAFDTGGARGTGVVASELPDFRAGGLWVSGAYPSAEPGSYDVSATYSLQDHGKFKAGNYALSSGAARTTLRGVIQPRWVVTAISGVQVNSRPADGTTDATFDTSNLRATGVPAAELADFRVGGLLVSGAFPSAEPGSYDVSVTYTLQDHGSFKASSHTLSAISAILHGEIWKASGQNSAAGCEPSAGDDYDADDDGLIEVCNLAQLSAVRFDLDGDGSAGGSSIDGAGDGYEAAFPGVAANGPGCPQSGCKGYELTAGLDFDTNGNGRADAGDAHAIYGDNGEGWPAIGEYAAVFEGNGRSISNLYFKSMGLPFPQPGERRGLFDELGESGVIRNLMLTNVKVDGNGLGTGALVGENRGAISNVGVSGTVSGWRMIGGLAGNNQGTVTDSHTSGEVSGGYGRTGGLVGMNAGGRILRSWSTADVSQGTSTSYEAWQTASTYRRAYGGLVGLNSYKMINGHKGPVPGSIVASYATGRVTTGADRTGGLVGRNDDGEIIASYATGDVSGASLVGGLVGSNFGPISASYALGAVSGTGRVGGLMGGNGTDNWNSFLPYATHRCIGCNLPNVRPGQGDRSFITTSYGNARGTAHQDRIRTAAELRQPTGYTGIYAHWDDLRDDRGDSYAWDFGTSLDFPVLRDTGPSVAAQRARMPNPPESTEPVETPANGPPAGKFDYDRDDDGLIEVWSLAQLHAIRYDMVGSGAYGWDHDPQRNSARDAYQRAYPRAMDGMGCPRSGCLGYELMTDLDFDTNGNGETDPGDHYWNGIHHPDDSAYCIDWYKWHPRQEVRETPGACDDYWGNDGEGWRPLAIQGRAWYGIFEGNGHAIRNLYMNTLDTPFTEAVLNRVDIYGYPTRAGDGYHNYRGLFDVISRKGVVRNLRLENVNVSGKDSVGALAGINRGIISNVHVTGSVSGISRVGGLVGYAKEGYAGKESFITGSSSRANVAGRKAGGWDVGGLVGLNQGVIQASYARGAVSGWADNTGGLVGRNAGGSMQSSLVGRTPGGSIAASYATGPVSSAGRYAGGLVGNNEGDITASYATGSGLVGRHGDGTVTSAYWDTQVSGQTASAAGIGKTTAQLQSPTGYAGIYADWNVDLDRDGSGDDPWDFGTASQYPVLQYAGSGPGKQREPFTAQALNLPRIGAGPPAAPNQAPTVAGSLGDVTLASDGGTREVSLTGLFEDGDGDSLAVTAHALTITAEPPPGHDGASYIDVVTVSVSSDYSVLTLTGRVAGTAIVTVTANDGKGGSVSTAFVATVEAAATGSASIADATIVNESGAHQASLSGVFGVADGGITAESSDETVATVSVAGDYSTLTVNAHARGTAVITVTAADGNGGAEEVPFTVTVKAAPVVASAISDVSGLEEGTTQDIALTGVFSDADNDALTITAASSDNRVATVSVALDGTSLTVAGVSVGTATITVTAQDADGNRVSDTFAVAVAGATPPEQQSQKDTGPEPANVRVVPGDGKLTVTWDVSSREGVADDDIRHALRWSQKSGVWANPKDERAGGPEDGLAVAGGVTSYVITGLKNDTATGVFVRSFVGSNQSERSEHSSQWVRVKGEDTTPRAGQQERQQETPNRPPMVANAIGDATVVNESGTMQVSLSGVFSDADSDSLTITAASSDETKATVSVEADYSGLTVSAQARGAATITVTADDGRGSRVQDTFTVTVKAAPVLASAISDVSGLEEGDTREVSLSGVFSDADNDSLTITASSSDNSKATVSVASDGSRLTLTGVAQGTATVTATAQDSDGNRVNDQFSVAVAAPRQQGQPNQPPTVSSAIAHATIVHQSGTQSVSLSGVFADADSESLTVAAGSSNEAVATVSVAADYSGLTVTAHSRGTATITVTADDGNGGTVEDAFTITVKATPTVASAISDVSGLEEGDARDVSLSGVFSDADNDALTITAASSDTAKATVSVASDGSQLTLTGVAKGTATITVTAQDSDGNRVSDQFAVTVEAPAPPPQETAPADGAPTVARPLADISLKGPMSKEISLSGVFNDPDGDDLIITTGSSDYSVVTMWASHDYSTLNVVPISTGTATITVTARDADGNEVSDQFVVTVSPNS